MSIKLNVPIIIILKHYDNIDLFRYTCVNITDIRYHVVRRTRVSLTRNTCNIINNEQNINSEIQEGINFYQKKMSWLFYQN